MLTKPNQTLVVARVEAIRPDPGGWGTEVVLRVQANESHAAESDFLRPAPGSTLRVFAAAPGELQVGDGVRAALRLQADAFGGRTVLERFDPLEA